jgi:Sensors of blue-light using FAD
LAQDGSRCRRAGFGGSTTVAFVNSVTVVCVGSALVATFGQSGGLSCNPKAFSGRPASTIRYTLWRSLPVPPFIAADPFPNNKNPSMAHILYCSIASWKPKASQWRELVRRGTAHNRAAAVSSLLIHGGGCYVHWLEGPRSTLQPLWQRIYTDARHHHVTLLLRDDRATVRLYPDWPLQVNGPIGLPEITNLVRDLCVHSCPGSDASDIAVRVVRQLLEILSQVPDPLESGT